MQGMTTKEGLIVKIAELKKDIAWKTKCSYNGTKLYSCFLLGFHTKYERIVVYPLLIDFWDEVNINIIEKEPVNNFKDIDNQQKLTRILDL